MCTLEPPCRGGSNEYSTYNVYFGSNIRQLGITLQTPVFYIEVGFKGVYIARSCFPDATRFESTRIDSSWRSWLKGSSNLTSDQLKNRRVHNTARKG